MSLAFAIELRPEVAHEVGSLFVGGAVKSFEVTLDRWRRWDYAESWQAQLLALLSGAGAVALMFDVPENGSEEPFRAFVCEPIEGDEVRVTERSYAPDAPSEAGQILAPLDALTERYIGTTTLAAVAAFMREAAWTSPH